jgi:hypothetical protein
MEGVMVMLVGTTAVLLPLQPEIAAPNTSALTKKQIVCCRNNDETNRMHPPRHGVTPERTFVRAYELNEIEMSSVEGSVLSVYPAERCLLPKRLIETGYAEFVALVRNDESAEPISHL